MCKKLIETREHLVFNYKLKNTYQGHFVAMYGQEKEAIPFIYTRDRVEANSI